MQNSFLFIPMFAQEYLYYLKNIKGLSKKTVDEYYLDLKMFFRFIAEYKHIVPDDLNFSEIDASTVTVQHLSQITLSDIYVFLNYVTDERHNNVRARMRKISSLKSFFRYLAKQGLITNNPTQYLDSPKMKKSLPVHLSVDEALKLLASVAEGKNSERNFLILTLFLNCGLRLSELVGINISNINGRTLRVLGKGNKERNIYLNESCIDALRKYLAIRGSITVKPGHENALFISRNGTRISNRMVQTIVESCLRKSNLDTEKFSTHKLRHTAATLMYQNGVDVRVLQEILGHSNLGTTQIYTHLSDSQIENAMENNPLNLKK